MQENSEHLNKVFESIGIKYGDPILNVHDEGNSIEALLFSRERTGSLEIEGKDEDEWCESINSDDIDAYQDFGTTPPKTERNRKQRGRFAYCSHAAAAAKSFTKRVKNKLASRCASLPMSNTVENYIGNAQDIHIPRSSDLFRQRKRSQDIQRSYERQCKFRMDELTHDVSHISPTTFGKDEDSGPVCESLPPIALAIKVPPRSRYLSLSFKKIGHTDVVLSPSNISADDLPTDRVAFFSHISGLLKHSNQDQTLNLKWQRSEEEVLYQQELNEMVWLELQAWHAGMNTIAYDNYLIEQRQKVKSVYEEVMCFNLEHILSTTDDRKSMIGGWNKTECTGCLSVWCDKCRERESESLYLVWQLLEKVDTVNSLFPSSRKLAQFFPQWLNEEYVMRHKAMCLWFNTTSQLRFVIDLLGRRLGHMTKDLIPWPHFPEYKFQTRSPCHSTLSKDSGFYAQHNEDLQHTVDSKLRPQKIEPVHKSNSKSVQTPVVRFEIEDLDEGSTLSSDPNQSTESDFTSVSSGSMQQGMRTTDTESDCDNPRIELLSPPPISSNLRRCSSDIFLEANPYRTYIEKLLRNKGMKKTLDKVAEVIRDIMARTICIIEESHCSSEDKEKDYNTRSIHESMSLHPLPLVALNEELHLHKNWTKKFLCMGLPNFHTLFLFLASVPLHMMRECLKLRLEQMPERPSSMSIRQLMHEYKEGVRFAVAVRQKFVKWCLVLLLDLPSPLALNLEVRKSQAIDELDSNVKKMLEVYLNWLDRFILMLHREPHVAGLQCNFLQDEWRFVQSTCPHVTDGESLAATRFCNIACHMLCSVRDFLDTGLDDIISDFQEFAIDDGQDEDDDIFDYRKDELEEEMYIDQGESSLQRRKLVQRCRSLQELVTEARERALRAIALAKMLKKDLEVAIEVKDLPDLGVLFDTLLELKYVLIKGHTLRNLLIFVPECLENFPEEILCLLQMQMGACSDLAHFYPYKFLLLINKPRKNEVQWTGHSVELQLTAECAISLSRIQVYSLMLIVKDGSQLQNVKRKLCDQMKGVLVFSNEQIAPHRAVTKSLHDMKGEALELCHSLEKSISDMESLVNPSQFFPNFDDDCRQLLHLTRDTIHQGFIFGFEYHKEAVRLVSGKQRLLLSPILINFCHHWMKFVKSNYSTGKGRRPRWALPGLEFFLLVCEPNNTKNLSDNEFRILRKAVEDCREYIIGCATSSDSSAPSTPLLMGRPFRSQTSITSNLSRQSSFDSPKFRRNTSALIRSNQPSIDKSEEFVGPPKEPMERVRDKIKKMDNDLEEKRIKEKLIGTVSAHHRDLIEIKSHTVSFSWHRGFKIGAGHFGKVYAAVNNKSGELMAMKVLPLQPNDHRSIQKVANELKIFERISHPHLVKYYGLEIHNDEMLMFMEYCDEGTLEALAKNAEGLPEEIVRKYTRQLLSAIHTLHDNSIVHRDVKGANIFLAQEGNILKLGDFGCAVRLRGLQTEIGELSGIVGTHAFMAPEIFRSNEGHGRAADIWSVGCVVIEMITGYRPWPQYDSSVQIMFQVGIGKCPDIPDKLSEEGHDYLALCFVQDPKEREIAAKLLDHTFVKVEDEYNASIPLFSLMPFLPPVGNSKDS